MLRCHKNPTHNSIRKPSGIIREPYPGFCEKYVPNSTIGLARILWNHIKDSMKMLSKYPIKILSKILWDFFDRFCSNSLLDYIKSMPSIQWKFSLLFREAVFDKIHGREIVLLIYKIKLNLFWTKYRSLQARLTCR